MLFWFALDLSDIDLWNIDLLGTHLDLLYTDIPSKHFVCLQDNFKTCFNTSSRRLQRSNFSSSKTSWRPTNVWWVCAQFSFLVGTTWLAWHANSSHSRDRSKNPVTLKKNLLPTVLNGWKTFTFALESLF